MKDIIINKNILICIKKLYQILQKFLKNDINNLFEKNNN